MITPVNCTKVIYVCKYLTYGTKQARLRFIIVNYADLGLLHKFPHTCKQQQATASNNKQQQATASNRKQQQATASNSKQQTMHTKLQYKIYSNDIHDM